MARKYMNRFAIEENDQFEIHVKDYKDQNGLYKEDIYNAAKEVLLKAQRGLGYYRLLVTITRGSLRWLKKSSEEAITRDSMHA